MIMIIFEVSKKVKYLNRSVRSKTLSTSASTPASLCKKKIKNLNQLKINTVDDEEGWVSKKFGILYEIF